MQKAPGAVTDSISFVFFFSFFLFFPTRWALWDLTQIYISPCRGRKGGVRCEDWLMYLPHSSEHSLSVTVSRRSNERNGCWPNLHRFPVNFGDKTLASVILPDRCSHRAGWRGHTPLPCCTCPRRSCSESPLRRPQTASLPCCQTV